MNRSNYSNWTCRQVFATSNKSETYGTCIIPSSLIFSFSPLALCSLLFNLSYFLLHLVQISNFFLASLITTVHPSVFFLCPPTSSEPRHVVILRFTSTIHPLFYPTPPSHLLVCSFLLSFISRLPVLRHPIIHVKICQKSFQKEVSSEHFPPTFSFAYVMHPDTPPFCIPSGGFFGWGSACLDFLEFLGWTKAKVNGNTAI